MKQFKTPYLALALGLVAPVYSYAANYCVAVSGGFGHGGTSFIGRNFALPAAGNCKPWSGFTKTGATVILTTTGTGCLSSNGKVLTLSLASSDPDYYGNGELGGDHIVLCPAGVSGCPISPTNFSAFLPGPAAEQGCSASLLNLPATHD